MVRVSRRTIQKLTKLGKLSKEVVALSLDVSALLDETLKGVSEDYSVDILTGISDDLENSVESYSFLLNGEGDVEQNVQEIVEFIESL